MGEGVREVHGAALGAHVISRVLPSPAWLSGPVSGWGLSAKRAVVRFSTLPRRRLYQTSKKAFGLKMCADESLIADDFPDVQKPVSVDAASQLASSGSSPEKGGQDDLKNQANGYDEFSQLLRLENQEYKSQEGRKIVSEAKPKKVEINPGDYDVFNSLLQQSGGTGRKTLKGSKRFVTKRQALQDLNPPQSSSMEQDDWNEPSAPEPVQSGEKIDASEQRSSGLSEEETAEAYAVMMEEFGADLHGKAVAPKPVMDPSEVVTELPIPQLRRPPNRPGGSVAKTNIRTPPIGEESQALILDEKEELAESALPLPSLKPKPRSSMPRSIKTEGLPPVQMYDPDDLGDAEKISPPIPTLLSKPSIESSKAPLERQESSPSVDGTEIHEEDSEAISSELGSTAGVKMPDERTPAVMKAPPTRPVVQDSHNTMVAGTQVSTASPLQTSENQQLSDQPGIQIDDNRGENGSGLFTGLPSAADLEALRISLGSGNASSTAHARIRKANAWNDMNAEVLQNPKLIYKIGESKEA